MNMTKKLIILSLALMPLMAVAQRFQAKNAEINLGQVKWKVPATATFVLKNTGTKPMKVKAVDTGCGCTGASYPRQSIEPGQQFELKTTYDSRILGHFARTVSVWSDADEKPLELVFRCHVVTTVENFSGDYPHSIGGLLADVDAIEFDDVNKGDVVTQDIHIMNPTGQYVTPVVMHLPPYLRAEFMPRTLGPKQAGVLHLTMNSRNLRLLGLNQANIYLSKNMGENVSEDKEIIVSSVLLPELTAQSEDDIRNAPRLFLSAKSVDMSKAMGKEKVKKTVLLKNEGNSMLEISAIQMFTKGLELTLPKRSLKPGESTKMKITGHTDILKKVRTRPRVLMITNDPNQQKVIIEIRK